MSDEKIIPATNDVVFKAMFVQNQDLLKAFLSAALAIPISEIGTLTIKNPEIPPVYIESKLARLDILAEINGRIVNIEMQVAKKEDYKERTLLYWARMYSEEMKKGKPYNSISRCICINVLDFGMFDCPEFHSSFSVREDTRHELLTDKMQLHFFELTKIKAVGKKNKPNEEDNLQLWLQLFKADSKEELEMLKNTSVQEIRSGVEAIYSLSKDDKIREYVRQRELAEVDHNLDIANAEARGRAEGRAEGKAEGMAERDAELAARWRAEGKTEAEIRSLLGL